MNNLAYKIAIILPVFNEQEVILDVIKEVSSFADSHQDYYFFFVDDGSTDNTYKIIKDSIKGISNMGVVHYDTNQGKGYAVKYGFASVKAELYCFTDGDLAYPLSLLETIEKELKNHDVIIGSRKLLNRKERPSILRHILGEGYNKLARWLLGMPFKDTQAGLKGFRSVVVKSVFPKIRIKGFGFDPEVLYIAKKKRFSIIEIPVEEKKTHLYKSCKIKLFKDSLRMLRDLLVVRVNDLLGRYE